MTKFIGTPLRGIEFANPGDEAISSRVSGDTQPRLRIDAGGRITWSDGTNSGDTVLFRSEANALTTYDSLTASAGLITLTTNGIPNQSLPNGAIAIDTTNHVFYFRSNNEWLEVSGGATVTVDDTPPLDPEEGDLWYSSIELELFIYYSNAWIQLTDSQGGVQELYELADVLIDDPVAGETLVYNGTEWENGTVSAATAAALETARTIELSGDVSGSASFDGTSNINIFTTVNTASVALSELYGVSLVAPIEEYQVLQHNGTVFTNEYPDTVSYVRNVDTVTLIPGVPVYLFGGNGDHATVKRADNSSDTTSSKTIGLVGSTIAQNENGPIVTRGYVDGIDLSVGYNAGDVLWLGKNGAFTTTKPSAPDHLVFLGVVVRATNNGLVYVAAQNGYEIEELHNVKINGVTDGQFLRYNSASALWVNDTINLGTETSGDYVQSIVAGSGISLTNNSGEGATPTVAIESTAWTPYTPSLATNGDTITIGNGTITGAYKLIGKTCHFRLKFTIGSTTSIGSGELKFGLPVTAASADYQFTGSILDNNNAWYGIIGNGNYLGSTTAFAVIAKGSSGTAWFGVTNNNLFSLLDGDYIVVNGTYEAA